MVNFAYLNYRALFSGYTLKVRIGYAYLKCQLTRTFCERLFCSSSNARISVSERPSGRLDSGILLAVCCRLAAVEKR